MRKAIIAGGTGMVGNLILKNCLHSNEVETVVSLVRKPTDHKNAKLQEIVITNFLDYDTQQHLFQNIDMAFFCIGVYTGAVEDDVFKQITLDYAVAFAKTLYNNSPTAKLCLLIGSGADRTEKSRVAFAKYKGMAENQIAAIGFESFYTFRPAYIYPVQKRAEPNLMYSLSRTLYPLLKLFGKGFSIKSSEQAKAMFTVGINGANKQELENKDILDYA